MVVDRFGHKFTELVLSGHLRNAFVELAKLVWAQVRESLK